MRLSVVKKILASANPKKVDGDDMNSWFVDRVWNLLICLNNNPDLDEALRGRQASTELARTICQSGVATTTGRIRGKVTYGAERNTVFQGLAADGAGLALFALIRAGVKVLGFIHDAILTAVPDEGGYVSLDKVRHVEGTLCREFDAVLPPDLHAACESTLSTCWSKKAKLIVQGDKVYPWRPEPIPRGPRR
jgi:hypothetical protein